MSRRGSRDEAAGRPVAVAPGQLPLFPLEEDGDAWWTKRPEVTVSEPAQSGAIENPWRGDGNSAAHGLPD